MPGPVRTELSPRSYGTPHGPSTRRVRRSGRAGCGGPAGRDPARRRALLFVAPSAPGAALLERVHDARRAGATVLALDTGCRDLDAMTHVSGPDPLVTRKRVRRGCVDAVGPTTPGTRG